MALALAGRQARALSRPPIGASGSGPANPFATSITVPRVGPNAQTFTVGRTSTAALTLAPQASGSGGALQVADIPAATGVDGVGIHQGNSRRSAATALEIGRRQSDNATRNNITIENYDFRGITYGIRVYGQNVTFRNCLFDLSALNKNFDFIATVTGNNGWVNFENCWADGVSSAYLIQEFVAGLIGYIRYCDFINIPGDWLFTSGASSAYVDEVDVSYNRVRVASTVMDSGTKLTGTGTGVTWSSASDSITITTGFTIASTTGAAGTTTNGGSVSISAGTQTIQSIMDAINASYATTKMIAAIDGGRMCVTAPCYNNAGVSTARCIDLSGTTADWEKFFGTGTTSETTRRSSGHGNVRAIDTWTDAAKTASPATYVGAHADVVQIPLSTQSNTLRFKYNLLDMTPDDSVNRAAGTSPFNVTSDLGDHNADFIAEYNTIITSRNGMTKNAGYISNSLDKAQNGYRNKALQRFYANEMQIGVFGHMRATQGHQHTGSVQAGWANPATFDATGLTNGDTITFSDGTQTVTVTVAANKINGQQIIDAINNASPFWLTASVSANALRISSRAQDASETRSNFLVIGSTGTGSSALTTFGLTAGTKTATSNGDLVNGFSFEDNFDYDAGIGTPVTAVWNGNAASASINPKLAAPASPSVTGQTSTTLTVSFTEVSGARAYQYSIDGGTNWATLTTSGSGTLTGTISGLTPSTTYNQIQVRALNAYNALGALRQNGAATASFSGTTSAAAPTYVLLTAGSGSWIVPAGVTAIDVFGIGAGSGGGGGIDASGGLGGTGGGAGAYAESLAISVTPGQTVYYNVPAGAAGNPAGTNAAASPASDTWLNKSTNAAPGSAANGIVAKSASAATGGASGSCIGSTSYSGGNGGASNFGAGGRGGGGAAGPSGAGKAGGSSGTGHCGDGGGGSNGGSSTVGANSPNSATTSGAGGAGNGGTGGGAATSTGDTNGNNGSSGGGGSGASAYTGVAGGVGGKGGQENVWTITAGGTAGPAGGSGGGGGGNGIGAAGAGGSATLGYGGGGGGGGCRRTGGTVNAAGGSGGDGCIVIKYT